MKLLFRWVINAVALLAITQVLEGFEVSSFYIALVTALILGLVNATIRPVILFFTLPLSLITLGLFTFVVNALLLWFVSTFIQGFTIAGFWEALSGALLLWVVSMLTTWLIKKK